MAEYAGDVQSRLEEIDDAVMDGLTPFQRATVKHIAKEYECGRRRILVADEVGLGKTLIARGVISKMALLRNKEGDDFVKVAYICSNGAIAAQNIEKLRIDGGIRLANADSSRLSMQHLELARERGDQELRSRYIQITPLTPGTSFSITSGTGTIHERALMWAVMTYDGRFSKESGRQDEFKRLMWDKRVDSNAGNWDWWTSYALREVEDARAGDEQRDEANRYPLDILRKVKQELREDAGKSFDDICRYLDGPVYDRARERSIIITLRKAFARACVNMLDPDFVIMDEFQRFRTLLSSEETETALLARRFLSGEVRVLLLSATPFRMYSTDAELESKGFGDSYREFIEVMQFLGEGKEGHFHDFESRWGGYVSTLRGFGLGNRDMDSVVAIKRNAEDVARGLVARTERQSTGELGAIADNRSHVHTSIEVRMEDVRTYTAMRRLLSNAGIRLGLMSADFVKSCPFPLSFMAGYKLFKELSKKAEERPSLVSATKTADGNLLWLRKWDIASYAKLRVGNARYLALWKDLTEPGAPKLEQLLWIPASKPYYAPNSKSPFAQSAGLSKMVLFSSWAMVPPSLACVLSYEFERRNVQRLERVTGNSYRYFKDGEVERAKSKEDAQALPYRRLRFDADQRSAFLLLYPSRYLADLIDVAELASSNLSLYEVRRQVRAKIALDLPRALGVDELPRSASGKRGQTIDWYVMAAIKLDRLCGFDVLAELLWDDSGLGFTIKDRYGIEHEVLSDIDLMVDRWTPEGAGSAPDDLVDVLADAAIGSAAVCALRAYRTYDPEVPAPLAFEFGHAFMSKLNTVSSTLAVAAAMEHRGVRSVHWKNVLAYSCEGNLQAVLDEYAFLSQSSEIDVSPRDAVLRMHRTMVGEGEKPDLYTVDARHWVSTPNRGGAGRRIGRMSMRTNIAAAFMDIKARTAIDTAVSRASLRSAFNSPFRPFILVSTSVGQEGLDFHQYCRKVCHWNLPGNPIDLEQREGRVNRYRGLSVRASIAARYGEREYSDGRVWDQLFDAAEKAELEQLGAREASGFLPNWGLAGSHSAYPVERYAYLYPFSRDVELYHRLVEQVSRYRAVLGQPDQEELLRLLGNKVDAGALAEEDLRELFVNLCPFVWQRSGGGEG